MGICYVRLSAWIKKDVRDVRMRDFYDSNLGIFYGFCYCFQVYRSFSTASRLIINHLFIYCETFNADIVVSHKRKKKFNIDNC